MRLCVPVALAMGSACLHAQTAAPPAAPGGIQLRLDPRLSESTAAEREGRPIFARGDRISGRTDRETTLEGDAEIRKGGSVVRGDRITYYPDDDQVVAVGNVQIVKQGNQFSGSQLQLKLDANEGFFENPIYYLPRYNGRGRADRIDFLGPDRLALSNGTYTTCTPDDPDWYIRGRELVVDENAGEGSGRSAGLVFKGRTILAAPVFSFPLGDERRTGFLAPTFSLTNRTGPEILTPFYWNIAPNRDLTLYPRLMTRRGLQLGGQARYLEPTYFGDVRFEYSPRDTLTDTSRYFWNVLHTDTNLAGWGTTLTARGVSDDNYFVDYSRSILASSERSLPRDLIMTRGYGDWSFMMRATRYQNILDARLAPPYERLPQLTANWVKRDVGGFDFGLLLDGTSFSRPLLQSAEGARFVANPTVSYPIVTPGSFIIPKVGLHASAYRLSENLGQATELTRVLPTFSIDSGLVFERQTEFFGKALTQTLEPRLFYVRTPYRDQSAFPVFDTAAADFNFAQLFSENTFIGNDRIADVNQLTTALVSRVIDADTGVENFRFAVGQRRYFSQQRNTIPGTTATTDATSDLLIAVAGDLGGGSSFDSGVQFGVRDRDVPRATIAYRFQPNDGRIFNTAVRYQRDALGQFDTSWRWPVAPRWTMLGRMNYSWLSKTIDPITLAVVDAKPGIVEGILGFEYTADCWVGRFVMQRFVTAAGTATSSFFLQLELSGLARLGSNPFDILRRSIPGYRLPTDRPPAPSRYFEYQ